MYLLDVAVYGASGYGGVELLRLLLQHPSVNVRQATSREPGRRVDAIHPGLRGLTTLVLEESRPESLDPALDAVFFALPHGESAAVADAVAARCPRARLFDLAQDFRTGHDGAGWVYGQPELFRASIAGARRVACPGCFATSLLLGTGPALFAGLRPQRIIVDAKTGSSGSGASPTAGTHHPTRNATFVPYKVFTHQHEKEVRASWERLLRAGEQARGGGPARPAAEALPPLHFVPQSAPLVRGILACCYLVFDSSADAARVAPAYASFYADSPFVRVVGEPPNVLAVRGTNNADVYVQTSGDVALVVVTIDNLVRGAAGQAVQCMNLAFGLAEDAGLRLAAMVP